ncbi:MAG TPA: radical SAM protein, partial [Bacillales bacterium]|nr:radical SAM protein [Bacillales bacterium]
MEVNPVPRAAYLHIPFCEHICHYCDFNKYFMDGQPVNDYLVALRKEIQETMKRFPSAAIETIYVGGGTPTALDHRQTACFMESIQESLNPKADEIEFTVEANPGNLDRKKLMILKEAGVNRLSIGVQSFDDQLLKEIGRTHTADEVYKTIEEAESVGFDN